MRGKDKEPAWARVAEGVFWISLLAGGTVYVVTRPPKEPEPIIIRVNDIPDFAIPGKGIMFGPLQEGLVNTYTGPSIEEDKNDPRNNDNPVWIATTLIIQKPGGVWMFEEKLSRNGKPKRTRVYMYDFDGGDGIGGPTYEVGGQIIRLNVNEDSKYWSIEIVNP